MQYAMQMCHSESRAEISVVGTAGEDESVSLVTGCLLPDKGTCRGLLGPRFW